MADDDKNAIREVLAQYCFHLDADEFEAMAALFTPDGTWDTALARAPAETASWPRRAASPRGRCARGGHI